MRTKRGIEAIGITSARIRRTALAAALVVALSPLLAVTALPASAATTATATAAAAGAASAPPTTTTTAGNAAGSNAGTPVVPAVGSPTVAGTTPVDAAASGTNQAATAGSSAVPAQTGTPATGTLTAATCDPAVNGKIVCENLQPGTPQTVWDLPNADAGDPTLQGFATSISVNVGQTESFKISSTSSNYKIDIYRLGYYGGDGARLIASITPSAAYPQVQPTCLSDPSTGLIDCGNWGVSASWSVPATAVSGVYIARLTRLDNGGASHIPFVVRDDSSHSAILLKTSDATWTAYNAYGGNSLYKGSPAGRAYKVSYNRPYMSRVSETDGHNWIFAAEFPMIKFLEANGYDISYTTDVDTARNGALIKNHKVFISSGHDEYWSQEQRDSVTAARDAGVNIAFFSGNEVYWKTRWEPSLGSTTNDFRTIVCYKETKNSSPIDPQYPAVWTGTWRDPRYSPPSNGGKPENGLTGTLYMVDPPTDFTMTIPASFGKLRFWRNTAVATAPAGTSVPLAAATLGYEFDTDADNGFRPAGLFDLTAQTQAVQAKLLDYGSLTGPGTVTHNMTEYRASSGALVFSSGTIQWSYGLDGDHDGPATVPNVNMQQATVNILADMKAQPATIMSSLTPATPTADTAAPTVSLTPGAHPVVGTAYTINGTATDAGGGVVAGVEVSTDGGITWHPAKIPAAAATTTWSYTYVPSTPGTVSISIRASDDSGNISGAQTGNLTVDRRLCPCTIFGSQVPSNAADQDVTPIEVGVRFRSTIAGTITGVRFYKGATNLGTHTGTLWSNTGTKLATGTFTGETASGWQTMSFATPVVIAANTTYVASYFAPGGHYAGDANYFASNSAYSAPLLALPDGVDGANGVYHAGASAFPTDTSRSANYWVDVVFQGDTATDVSPPQVIKTSPLAGSSSVAPGASLAVTFTEPFLTTSVAFTLKNPAGVSVPGTIALNPGGLSATFTPNAPLAGGTKYTATISAADFSGHTLTPPYSWTFTTGAVQPPAGTCPCTLFSDQSQPTFPTVNDPAAIELGVRITPSQSGYLTGIRFFKGPSNTGTHVGTVWNAAGQALGTVTFTGESTTGWQQATFAAPIAVTAGTTYTVGYHTDAGYYSSSGAFFTSDVTYGPLTAPAAGGNGVFAYGANPSFPSSSYNATNYWVDAVFTTAAPPPAAPVVVRVSPAAGRTGVALAAAPSVVFDRSLNGPTAVFTLKAGATSVAGTTSYSDPTKTVTFVPSAPLVAGTTYTASVTASSAAGAAMTAPYTWTFTTGTPATCPCTLWPLTATPANPSSTDTGAYELGTQFVSDTTAWVTGVRFYKGVGNTGVHTGSLWSTTGARLATGTFSGESATGWQTLTFGASVKINANTTYVVSYHVAAGGYAYDPGYFATNDLDAAPLHAFASGPLATNGVFAVGASAYPAQSFNSTNYWVTPVVTTTAPVVTCPCTLFGAATPAVASTTDTGALELGVKFTADVTGKVTGIRFYKGTGNTGTHTGTLWSATGAVLATGTFTGESATGWQTLTFATPVAITANTTYVASYHATSGGYSYTSNFFASPFDAAPLHAPAGGNGLYLYGTGGFPTNTFGNTNYFVDVTFTPGP